MPDTPDSADSRTDPAPMDRAERFLPDHVKARLAGAEGLVVGLDFDMTLAPMASDPDAGSILPANEHAVSALARRSDTIVAVISGRALDDLRPRVGLEDVVYVGNHGLEVERAGNRSLRREVEPFLQAVSRACSAIEERVGDVPGCDVERKGPTASVHYRRTPSDHKRTVRAATAAVVAEVEGVRLVTGKQVVEIRPEVDWDKGSAMQELAGDAPENWRAVYVGDDATDEDVFRILGPADVGVRVGECGDTSAVATLPEPASVASFLEWLDEDVLGEDRRANTRR